MNFTEAIAYLDTFVNFERKTLDRDARKEFTLDGARELSRRLGEPWRKFPSLHVAGTKGKGSACAFAASILRAENLRVGLYVSPHLNDVRERLSIDGEWIGESDFARLLSECKSELEAMRASPELQRPPTYFEVLTHLAFAWFAEQRVDAAVIEVGLGGRLDATNIITPVACGITNISLDHTAILGGTVELIAREKAGIFKPGVWAVSAPQDENVARVLRECAAAASAPIEFASAEELRPGEVGEWPLPRAETRLAGREIYSATLGLRGRHQMENWAVAVRLADRLLEKIFGRRLSHEAVAIGSRNTVWPGRLEILPAKNGALTILDGAHNAHSVATVLDECRANLPERAPLVCVFGCASDKDVPGMLAALARGADKIVFTDSGNPRGIDPQELLAEWRKISTREARVEVDTRKAMAMGTQLAGKQGAVLALGSLYLVGKIKAL